MEKVNAKNSLLLMNKNFVLDKFDSDGNLITNSASEDNVKIPMKLFSFENGAIFQRYDFLTGDTDLFHSINDDNLELLYKFGFTDEIEKNCAHVFLPDGGYTAIIEEDGFISSVLYRDSMSYKRQNDIESKPSKISFVNKLKSAKLNYYLARDSVDVIENGEVINNKLYNDFRKYFIRYNLSTQYIPASCIIQNIQKIINTYIVTRQIDEEKLLSEYIKLCCFSELCSGTITEISKFINDPSNIDLRDLCNTLNSRVHNLQKSAKIQLEDILKDNELEK